MTDSELIYLEILEQVPDTVFFLDTKGTITYVNPHIRNFLGYEVDKIIHTNFIDYVVQEDKRRFAQIYELSSEEIWDEEIAIIDVVGDRKYARIRCRAHWNGNGVKQGYDGVMRDRTLPRKLEEDLRAQKQALVEKIRVIDDLYEHVVQSGKCKAIEEHTAEVAHELRQPLAIVGGFARRMARQFDIGEPPDLEKHRQYTSIIVTEVQRLEKILDRLIDFTERRNLNLQLINPNDLIEYILEIAEGRMKQKKVRLEVNLGPEVSEIPIDPGRFQQLVLNLVSNAVEASPQGGTVELHTGVSLPSDAALRVGELVCAGYFEMKIKNHGPVIPPEALQKIFNPFYTTKQKGTGLGLSITKKIVEDHSGSISVKSDLIDGTVFTIWLPFNEVYNKGGFCHIQRRAGTV